MQKGLIHIYCGDGKGKTTAAMGLCLRALGNNKSVVVAQFLKGAPTGEVEMLKKLGATVITGESTQKFVFQMTGEEKGNCKTAQNEHLKKANDFECDILLLDEICSAHNLCMVDDELLKKCILEKPTEQEIIVTGREPAQWLLDAADYITEMKCIRHPYDSGVPAREGIEY